MPDREAISSNRGEAGNQAKAVLGRYNIDAMRPPHGCGDERPPSGVWRGASPKSTMRPLSTFGEQSHGDLESQRAPPLGGHAGKKRGFVQRNSAL